MPVKFTSSNDLCIMNNKVESMKTILQARQKTHPNSVICYHKVRHASITHNGVRVLDGLGGSSLYSRQACTPARPDRRRRRRRGRGRRRRGRPLDPLKLLGGLCEKLPKRDTL